MSHSVRSRLSSCGFLGLGVMVILLGISQSAEPAQPPKEIKESDARAELPQPVITVKPERKTVTRSIDQPGQVRAYEQTPLFAKIAGYVEKVNVDIGTEVKKDQILAEIAVPEMEEELKQKQAQVVLADAGRVRAQANLKRR